mmetsp:Transcript_14671/g.39275  ORF Transcript_14671/g.39275 Transcript_14671/m.39275 type:complete len:262 (-) Transcript_14671:968-1753(-)
MTEVLFIKPRSADTSFAKLSLCETNASASVHAAISTTEARPIKSPCPSSSSWRSLVVKTPGSPAISLRRISSSTSNTSGDDARSPPNIASLNRSDARKNLGLVPPALCAAKRSYSVCARASSSPTHLCAHFWKNLPPSSSCVLAMATPARKCTATTRAPAASPISFCSISRARRIGRRPSLSLGSASCSYFRCSLRMYSGYACLRKFASAIDSGTLRSMRPWLMWSSIASRCVRPSLNSRFITAVPSTHKSLSYTTLGARK